MLLLGKLVETREAGCAAIAAAIESGRAAERFARMVTDLGGPAHLLDRPSAYLPRAPFTVPVPAAGNGFVTRMAARDIGLVVVGLGGGRVRPEDKIDHSVGLSALVSLGQQVTRGEPLGYVHAADPDAAARAAGALARHIEIGPVKPAEKSCILARVQSSRS